MKPRIFISAVSRELKSARQLAANTLTALGYEPVWQDVFDSGGEDLRALLRKKIDDSSAVLQIVGDAYGCEPPTPDEHFGRVSYTQYEALYARARGKKVYYLVAEPSLPRDAPADTIDAARDDSPAGESDAAERRGLQQAYRAGLSQSEHIYYPVQTHEQAELTIRKLREELDRLRRSFRHWMAGVSLALLVLVGGVTWLARGQQRQEDLLRVLRDFEVDEPQIRRQLEQYILDTYKKANEVADKLEHSQKRKEAKELAKQGRDEALARVDEFLQSLVSEIESGGATPEYFQFVDKLQHESPEAALAYIATQEDRLLFEARRLKDQQRRKLAPLLKAAEVSFDGGHYENSRKGCDELLRIAPDWPQALHLQFWNTTLLGDRVLRSESITAAERYYLEGKEIAERLAASSESHAQAGRNLSVSFERLGNIARETSQVHAALGHYKQGMKICRSLSTDNPNDVQLQLDLSGWYDRLGDVSLQLGEVNTAQSYFELGLEVCEALIASGHRSNSAQRGLSVSFNKLGDVMLEQDQDEAALRYYERCLEISRELRDLNPRDDRALHDLATSYERLGKTTLKLGQTQAALNHYEKCLEIGRKLAHKTPSDVQAQRGLSLALVGLGDVSRRMDQAENALNYYEQAQQIGREMVKADPQHSELRYHLALSCIRLGDTALQLDQAKSALGHYEEGLELVRQLAADDARDSYIRHDLAASYCKVGSARAALGENDAAREAFAAGVAVLDTMIANGQNVEQSKKERAVLLQEIEKLAAAPNEKPAAKPAE